MEVVGLDRLSLVAFPDPLHGPEQVALSLELPLQFAGTRISAHPGLFRHPYCSIPFSITASGLAVAPAILAAKTGAYCEFRLAVRPGRWRLHRRRSGSPEI